MDASLTQMDRSLSRLRRNSPFRAWLEMRRENSDAAPYSALFRLFNDIPLTSLYCRVLSHFNVARADPNDLRAAVETLTQAELSESERYELCVLSARLLQLRLRHSVTVGNAIQMASMFACAYTTCFAIGDLVYCFTKSSSVEAVSNFCWGIISLICAIGTGYATVAPAIMTRVGINACLDILIARGGPESLCVLQAEVIRSVGPGIQLALNRAVRMIDETWYGRLPSASMKLLIGRAFATNEGLAVDAIKALRYVGRSSEVRSLMRLARPGRPPTVREAAAEAIAVVQRRIADETERSTLVRASNGSPDELLRASIETEDNIADLLIAVNDSH